MSEFISIEYRSQIQLALSAVAAQTAALPLGKYDIISTVDCYIKIDVVANDVTVNTGYPLFAGNQITVDVTSQRKIGAISTVAGTLTIHRVQ